jgi:hypothetical protein
MTSLDEEAKLTAFAVAAAKQFAFHSELASFGDIKPGAYLALRWGLGNDCVLVLKLDPDFQPVNFQQAIYRGDEAYKVDERINK